MKAFALIMVVTALVCSIEAAAETNNRSVHLSFTFGSAGAAKAIQVTPATVYNDGTGYGFEPGAAIVAHEHFVSADTPFLFSVKVPEGNYNVHVKLGDDAGQSSTTVKAEARRLMLENVRTKNAALTTRDFTVNVRATRIGEKSSVRLKPRERETETVTWDDKLTLEFNGSRPCLRTLEITTVTNVPTVFIAGDSTVCDQPREPWNSWGQMLPRFLKPGIALANYAESGESIRSSLGARRFEKIFSVMKPGDWLLIQFGHNDMKDRATNAPATYRANLKRLIAATRAIGGTPVLITSMERKAGVNGPTLDGYPDAVREVAQEENAALIDLNKMSVTLYRALGSKIDQAFQDGTHHNNYGSYELAKCVAVGIEHAKIDLAKFLVPEVRTFDPARPDPVESFAVQPSAKSSAEKPDGN